MYNVILNATTESLFVFIYFFLANRNIYEIFSIFFSRCDRKNNRSFMSSDSMCTWMRVPVIITVVDWL